MTLESRKEANNIDLFATHLCQDITGAFCWGGLIVKNFVISQNNV